MRAWPEAVDSTRPKISTVQASKCTKSAPGSLPLLLMTPVPLTVNVEEPIAMIEIVPPPGG